MDFAEIKNVLSMSFMVAAVLGVGWWAFSPKRREKFKDAANLPFADETSTERNNRDAISQQKKGEKE